MKIKNRQTGISLIESLVASLVFALGITALIRLQGAFFKYSSAANARSIAMSIAEEKLEDLRSFQTTDSSDGDSFDFNSIASNAGGRCTEQTDDNTCTVELASTGTDQSIVVGNTGYSRNWTVTDYYFDNAGLLCTPFPNGNTPDTCTASAGISPDQKRILVTIGWTDMDGSAQTLSLDGLINRHSGAAIGILTHFAGGSGNTPKVPYLPSADEHVVPIDVGTGSKRETQIPSTQTLDGLNRSKLTAYTHDSAGNLIRKEEFQNVACTCRFDGTGSELNPTYTAAHPEWNASEGAYADAEGDPVTGKPKGCVTDGGNQCASNPDAPCDICCRDHHDAPSSPFKYDPYRSADDFTAGGDHKHYNGSVPVTSGQYLESCRLKRIYGVWRVFEDWHMVHFTVLPLSDLLSPAIRQTYADYVRAVVDEHIEENKVAGETLTAAPAKPSALNHTASGNYVNLSVNEVRELTGRAVFIDYIDSAHLAQVRSKKSAGQDYLLHLPFYELEVGTLSQWSASSTNNLTIGPYDGPGNSDDLVGGQIKALGNEPNSINVTASIKKSNSGLIALDSAVDYNASTNPDSSTHSDGVNVCIGCTAPASCTLPWGATLESGGSATAYQTPGAPSGQTCASQTRVCSNGILSGSYSYETCAVAETANCTTPWGDTVASGSSVTAYRYGNEPSGQCENYKQIRTCTDGTLSGSYAHMACINSRDDCTLPWGSQVANGSSATAYQAASVPYGETCTSELRTCTDGTLSGSYTFQTCSVLAAVNCATPWGTTVLNGNSVIAYQAANAPQPVACISERRTCSSGVLSGSFPYSSCSAIVNTCMATVSGKGNNNETLSVAAGGVSTACLGE